MGALPLKCPRSHQVCTGAPTACRLHLFVPCPSLFCHLSSQGLDGPAALHDIDMLPKPSLLAQDMLDVAGPTLGTHGLVVVLPPFRHLPEIVSSNFQPVHAPQHRSVSRDGVAEQRVAGVRGIGMESERRGLGFEPHHSACRHAHRGEQPRPQSPGPAGHRHARQHIGAEGEAQRRMLRRIFERPARRHKHVQGFLRGAEHRAQCIDGQHASVLPFGRVHAPHVKRRHRRVPSLCVKRQRFYVKFVLEASIPRARAAHHLPFRPRHQGAQGSHGVVTVDVERHHLWVDVSEQRPERLAIHPFGRRSDAFDPMHEALHHGVFLRKALLNLPASLGPGPHRHLDRIHRLSHHLRDAQSVPSQLTCHVLLATGCGLPPLCTPGFKKGRCHATKVHRTAYLPGTSCAAPFLQKNPALPGRDFFGSFPRALLRKAKI